jgi:hypothetical protein
MLRYVPPPDPRKSAQASGAIPVGQARASLRSGVREMD